MGTNHLCGLNWPFARTMREELILSIYYGEK